MLAVAADAVLSRVLPLYRTTVFTHLMPAAKPWAAWEAIAHVCGSRHRHRCHAGIVLFKQSSACGPGSHHSEKLAARTILVAEAAWRSRLSGASAADAPMMSVSSRAAHLQHTALLTARRLSLQDKKTPGRDRRNLPHTTPGEKRLSDRGSLLAWKVWRQTDFSGDLARQPYRSNPGGGGIVRDGLPSGCVRRGDVSGHRQ
mmetsp:Transcript_7920/g.17532  ORF Transcript_7920/g.17532 Transcript_7920/m.17532 type:complete len:201 (-) Transcript_7920:755-1357(-)